MPQLTDATLKALQTPHRERIEVGDTQAPGLRVRAGKTGGVAFVLYLHAPEGRRVLTIGHYPSMSLVAARARVRELQAANRDGQLGRATAPPEVETMVQLAELFTGNLTQRRKRPKRAIASIKTYIIPVVGELRVVDFRWSDAIRVIEGATENGPVIGKLVADLLRQMMGFAVFRDLVQVNPCAGRDSSELGTSPGTPRERFLTGEEIGLVWNKLNEKANTRGQRTRRLLLRLLMLIPSRPGAVCRMRWQDVDLAAGTWTVPLSDRKLSKKREAQMRASGNRYVLPLGPAALGVLAEAKATAGGSPWVFPASKDKTKPTSPVGVAEQVTNTTWGIAPWHPHDLRRSVRTHSRMTLKAPGDVAEACLDHTIGTAMERVYNRSNLAGEMRELLTRWETFVLDRATVATSPNVVTMQLTGAAG